MLRFAEIGLFLVPFGLYAAWLANGARLPRAAIWVAVAATAVMVAGVVWFGVVNAVPSGARYAPARIENGVIVPGHAVTEAP